MLAIPSADEVRKAVAAFDVQYDDVESALKELFRVFPGNQNRRHVLLKVAALNGLYSTQIFALQAVAQHIFELDPDRLIADGDAEIVHRISRITIQRKTRHNYSFATKYCSWHNQECYPIWDSRVEDYLLQANKREKFAPNLKRRSQLWNYGQFREVVVQFRDFYGLQSFTFKDLDKFLWEGGDRLSKKDVA